jgi:negative regulator of flagellin synthesis FlgM
MKIGPLDSQPVSTTPAAPAERRGVAASAQSTAEPSARVALSTAATQLTGASSTSTSGSAADPAFDTAKVERISQAIRDGKFSVNPEAIADRLIINAAELLGGRSN